MGFPPVTDATARILGDGLRCADPALQLQAARWIAAWIAELPHRPAEAPSGQKPEAEPP